MHLENKAKTKRGIPLYFRPGKQILKIFCCKNIAPYIGFYNPSTLSENAWVDILVNSIKAIYLTASDKQRGRNFRNID